MDFQLSEEQRMIKEMARETVAREIEPVAAAHPPDQPHPKEAMLDAGARSNKEAAMAKWFATENCLKALHMAMQIHGASGLTREVGLERLMRDARMLTIPDGTTQVQHLIVGQELTGIKAFRSQGA